MIDMRRRYYGQLKNPRVIHTKFKDEVLVSLRVHRKLRPSGAKKFLRLCRSPTMDLDSVIDMYYDNDLLVVQESGSSECGSFSIWDDFLADQPHTVSMVSIEKDMEGKEASSPLRDKLGSGGVESNGPHSSVSDGIVDVDFLSAWLADSGTEPAETPPTTCEEAPQALKKTADSPKSEDVWARTFADAKAYFCDSAVGCKSHAQTPER